MAIGRDSESAIRMRALRRVHSKDFRTAKAFADHVGIPERNWNNYERGLPLGKEAAFTLVRAIPGLTTDWLHLAKSGGLTVRLARELEAAVAEERAEAEEKAKTGPL